MNGIHKTIQGMQQVMENARDNGWRRITIDTDKNKITGTDQNGDRQIIPDEDLKKPPETQKSTSQNLH